MGFKLSHLPMRAAAGAFLLNSGIGKRELDPESTAGLQQMAANGIPAIQQLGTDDFRKLLSYGEIALGSALLTPFVPAKLAGLGLAAFSGSLVWIYHKTPGLTEDGIRPTAQGVPLAKDTWLFGIAMALILDKKNKKQKISA